ncbi:hypothetical protein AB0M12_32810 [Nocardia vinacea]|uniref:hypothetical protein n=1 Tax=Nocardia vinacea TaxID=96468 RepID=UPI00342EE54B
MVDQSRHAVVPASAALAVAAGLSVTAESRHNLATQYLWTARSAAKQCGEREADLVANDHNEVNIEHRTLAITAVVFSVFFLEAWVNQLFADAADANPGQSVYLLAGLADAEVAKLANWWRKTDAQGKTVNERKSALQKYQQALNLLGKPRLGEANDPYLSAYDLIELRNALVHFKPEWQGQSVHPIEQMLKKHSKFTENQQRIGSPWYPNKCFGAGCAAWACGAAMALADDWSARMGLTHDYKADFHDWPPV